MCKGTEATERIWSVDIARGGEGSGQGKAAGAGRSQLMKSLECQVKDPGLYSESHRSQGRAMSKGVARLGRASWLSLVP